MNEFLDAVELFIGVVNGLKKKQINLSSSLDEIVLKACGTNLAYVDNRRNAKEEFNFDFWDSIKKQFRNSESFLNWIKSYSIDERFLYSKSEQFPDFLLKVKKHDNKLICGSLLELKDSKGGSIASFNSTLPTKYKSLDEVDIINGNNLVSRITSIMDGKLASDQNYHTFQRRNFYFIRTHKDDDDKVRISIVDGSFFETVSKEHLINQMLLNILQGHLEKKGINISPEILNEVEKSISYVTDQTIIAASQNIEKASIRPRLRIMAEVHPEGNPHGSFYPEISERSVNLIIQSSPYKEKIIKTISKKIPDVDVFSIKHKRNGDHTVFQIKF
ncbi:MAG: hypothetical protein BWX60_00063 [Candidatus Marinimicrobia bacterium ADurb.Bin030]|jgi:hypothetical protein|nr:MAG: hypothetical protein BWX60_00063 [Candidatus Marinimicrobia bacterium ADurb.Bin030]HPN75142.1 hypothetical protein [Candidatus Neomarinimicrobiota bacterium]HQQ86162.1 hypothetical protein [Candidatus Neomarinimicrobiota bacterium]